MEQVRVEDDGAILSMRHAAGSQSRGFLQAVATYMIASCLLAFTFGMSTPALAEITEFGELIGDGTHHSRWSRSFKNVNGEPTVTVSNGIHQILYVFTVPAGTDRQVDGTEMDGSGDMIWEALGECIDMITDAIILSRPTRQEQRLWKGSRWVLELSLHFVIQGVDAQNNPIPGAEVSQSSSLRAFRVSGQESWSTVLPALARTTSSSFGYGPSSTSPVIRPSIDSGRFSIGSDTLVLGGSFSCRRESSVLVVCRQE